MRGGLGGGGGGATEGGPLGGVGGVTVFDVEADVDPPPR